MKSLVNSAFPAIVILASSTALAVDIDISPRVSDGKILADGHDDGSGETTTNLRVFAWEFGELPADPFVMGDPGFNAFPGSGLPGGSQFGVGVLEDLSYWDGTGLVDFGVVPSGETLVFQFGSQSRTVGDGTGALANLFFGPAVSGDGGFHEHLNSFLQGSDGNAIPASTDGIEAAGGVYLVTLSLVSSSGSVEPSDPIFALFNNGVDESNFNMAMDHAQANLVPEPSVAAITWFVMGGYLVLSSRKGGVRRQ